MLRVKLTKNNRQQVLELAAAFLRAGKIVVYPTDTAYGLGADGLNLSAVRRLYLTKGRSFKQPVHVLLPSVAAAKKLMRWNSTAQKLADKFLPGALSIALPFKSKNKSLLKLSAGTGMLGFRLPKNGFAIELAKKFGRPVTATSANPSGKRAGGFTPYSAEEVLQQFTGRKHQPDLIIDAGRSLCRKTSTFVRIIDDVVEILREGPISNKKIRETL